MVVKNQQKSMKELNFESGLVSYFFNREGFMVQIFWK